MNDHRYPDTTHRCEPQDLGASRRLAVYRGQAGSMETPHLLISNDPTTRLPQRSWPPERYAQAPERSTRRHRWSARSEGAAASRRGFYGYVMAGDTLLLVSDGGYGPPSRCITSRTPPSRCCRSSRSYTDLLGGAQMTPAGPRRSLRAPCFWGLIAASSNTFHAQRTAGLHSGRDPRSDDAAVRSTKVRRHGAARRC